MTLEISPEELTILVQALSCYDLEIANEDDNDYPIFEQLQSRIVEAYHDICLHTSANTSRTEENQTCSKARYLKARLTKKL